MGTGQVIEVKDGRSKTDGYAVRNRGGMGVATFKVRTDSRAPTGLIVGIAAATRDEEIMLISRKGIVIRTTLDNVRPKGRDTSGVRVMNLGADDEVVAIAQFPEPEEELPKPETKTGSAKKNGAKPKAKTGAKTKATARSRRNGKAKAAEAEAEAAEEPSAELDDDEPTTDIVEITPEDDAELPEEDAAEEDEE